MYETASEREKNVQEARARLDAALQPFNQSAPRPFIEENRFQYESRTLPLLQKYAPGLEDIRSDDIREGPAFEHFRNQIHERAAQEARRPTQIPDGELREVVRRDATGRPFFEYFGKPSAWLKDFTANKKKLVGIRGDGTQFIKP